MKINDTHGEDVKYSVANCGGFIEASNFLRNFTASILYSVANCGGFIEADQNDEVWFMLHRYSVANCGGFIEAMTYGVIKGGFDEVFRRKLRRLH